MYQRTSSDGVLFRTSQVFQTDSGPRVFIERNHRCDRGHFFLLTGLWSPEEAKAKIDFFCREAQT